MPEECGEQRQFAVHVLARVVPVQQRAHRQRVPQIVWSWPDALAGPLQADLADQPGEPVVELRAW